MAFFFGSGCGIWGHATAAADGGLGFTASAGTQGHPRPHAINIPLQIHLPPPNLPCTIEDMERLNGIVRNDYLATLTTSVKKEAVLEPLWGKL